MFWRQIYWLTELHHEYDLNWLSHSMARTTLLHKLSLELEIWEQL